MIIQKNLRQITNRQFLRIRTRSERWGEALPDTQTYIVFLRQMSVSDVWCYLILIWACPRFSCLLITALVILCEKSKICNPLLSQVWQGIVWKDLGLDFLPFSAMLNWTKIYHLLKISRFAIFWWLNKQLNDPESSLNSNRMILMGIFQRPLSFPWTILIQQRWWIFKLSDMTKALFWQV